MDINQVISKLEKFKPVSIFLYGSQATNSQNSQSDYEIGVIFEDESYVNRTTLRKDIPDSKFAIFPFKESEIKNCSIDTPFQKNIYIASLVQGNGKTIYGEEIVENIAMPQISTQDLLMDTSFNLGYALSAVRVMKIGQIQLANEFFYKSLFYSTRNLLFFRSGKLISGYNNIYNQAKTLDLPDQYQALLDAAFNLRNGIISEIDSSLYFKNISYINQFVIPSIQKSF